MGVTDKQTNGWRYILNAIAVWSKTK